MAKLKYPAQYDLAWLHGKQGDDLSFYSTKKRATAAFRAWARQLERAARDVHRVADALRGGHVKIDADGSFIGLTALDTKAKDSIEGLVKARLASRVMVEDVEDVDVLDTDTSYLR